MLALGWLWDQTRRPCLPGRSGSGLIDDGNRRKAEMPMVEIRTAHLMTLTLSVGGMQAVGATPSGNRRLGLVSGGTFSGERLHGTVLQGGADWIMVRGDGSTTLDVRLVLETDDKALIGMTYRGMRHGPTAVMDRLNRGENVDPSEYYFRT